MGEVLRQGLSIYPRLASYSQRNPPVSASQGLVLQAWTTKPGCDSLVFSSRSRNLFLFCGTEITELCGRRPEDSPGSVKGAWNKTGLEAGVSVGFECFITKSCGKAEMKPQAPLLTGLALEEWLVSRSAKVRRKLGLLYSYVQTPGLLSFAWFGVSKTQLFWGPVQSWGLRTRGSGNLFCLGVHFNNAKGEGFLSTELPAETFLLKLFSGRWEEQIMVFSPSLCLVRKPAFFLPESLDISTDHGKIYFLKIFMAVITRIRKQYSILLAQYLGCFLEVNVA